MFQHTTSVDFAVSKGGDILAIACTVNNEDQYVLVREPVMQGDVWRAHAGNNAAQQDYLPCTAMTQVNFPKHIIANIGLVLDIDPTNLIAVRKCGFDGSESIRIM